ncbi:MAG: hypothetical protein QXR53_03380 [Candidatus Norongarragalinales archaeon]
MRSKKGFISAPLIGTVIFLSAVVFVVNLQNVEAQNSLRIANDAYHNRISSVLEQHRSDLASIFREGLSRTISYYLLNPGWDVFVWNNDPNSRYYSTAAHYRNRNGLDPDPLVDGSLGSNPDPGRVSLAEVKFAKCETVKALTSDVICSIPDSVNLNNEREYKYGLPQWMSKFVENEGIFVFEGITFNTSNQKEIKVFLPGSRTDVSQAQAVQEYQDYCKALLRGSVFDCKAFATQTDPRTGGSLMRCSEDLNNDGTIQENEILEGCEDGRFFVRVNVENEVDGIEVYPNIPRVEAKDTGGNVFRSSGVGEKNFYLPINLRIFKYFDETFKVYSHLAYGPTESSSSRAPAGNEGNNEGVADGNCGQAIPNRCERPDSGFNDGGYDLPNAINPNDIDKIVKEVRRNYFDLVFKRACTQANAPDLDLRFCSGTACDPNASPKCDASLVFTPYDRNEDFPVTPCEAPGGGDRGCAFVEKPAWRFLMVDSNAAFRIDPQRPVNFEWGVQLQHDTV